MHPRTRGFRVWISATSCLALALVTGLSLAVAGAGASGALRAPRAEERPALAYRLTIAKESRPGTRPERRPYDAVGEPMPFGTAGYWGAPRSVAFRDRLVSIASSPQGDGYLLAAAGGAVFRYGDARYFGSARRQHILGRVVDIVPTPDGGGYWLAASGGAVYHFGDAEGRGSEFGKLRRTRIVSMAAAGDGGYWLAAADGAVYHFGTARGHGQALGRLRGSRIVAMAAAPGGGYWLAAGDGAVYHFGAAHGYGSPFGKLHGSRIVAMAPAQEGHGYWLFAADGAVYPFGSAHRYGQALRRRPLDDPIIAAAAQPDGRGYWLLATVPASPLGLPAPGPGFVVGRVTAIGDSVMLDAQPDLEADIRDIDVEAMVSRQWDEGMELAQQLKSEGRLGAVVVIDLGTNGPVTPQMFTQMMGVLAGASRVVFVTIHLPHSYSWWRSVNQTLEAGVPKYSRDRLADFNKLADENPQWFGPDGVHMPIGGAGAQAMAKLIKSEI